MSNSSLLLADVVTSASKRLELDIYTFATSPSSFQWQLLVLTLVMAFQKKIRFSLCLLNDISPRYCLLVSFSIAHWIWGHLMHAVHQF